MRVYESNGEGGLADITGDRSKYFRHTTASVFYGEGAEIYVLVPAGERSAWKLPDGQLVSLYNTHCTGELRWSEPSRGGQGPARYRELSPAGILAAQHFGILPTTITPEEWEEAIDSYKIRIEDLPEVEVAMLKKAASDGYDGMADFTTLRGEPSPPESSAMYSLNRSGLAMIGGSGSYMGKTSQTYYITDKGRTLLKDGVA